MARKEYYVWDCAAGTGNLFAGLTNKYHIFASTLDQSDVNAMHERIENGALLLHDYVFQFDFLNDNFCQNLKAENYQTICTTLLQTKKKEKIVIVY